MKVEKLNLRMSLFNKKQFLSIFCFWFPIFTSVGFFYHLESKPLWSDEIQTWHTVSRFSWEDFFISLSTEHAHPPLYFFIMWIFGFFVDWTEYTLRIFSALCALGTNVALFNFFKKYISNTFAICFSIMFGFSYSVRYFAQEARPYALLIFLTCLSCIFFIQLLEKLNENREDKVFFFKWLATLFFLISTHYYGVILALSEGLIFLFFSLKRKKIFFVKFSVFCFFIFSTLLSFFILKDLKLEKLTFLDKLNVLDFIKELLSEFGNILIFEQYQWVIFILLIINYFFYIKKFNVHFLNKNTNKNIVFIFLCLTGTFLIFFLLLYLTSLVRPIYTFRYLYFLNPIFLFSLTVLIYFLIDIVLYFLSNSASKAFVTKLIFLIITICVALEMFQINLGQTDYNRLLTQKTLRQMADNYNKFSFLSSSREKVFIEAKKTHELDFYIYKMGLDVQSWIELEYSRAEKEFEYEQILNVEQLNSFLYLFYSKKISEKNEENINERIKFFNNLNYKENILTEDKNSILVRFILQKK